MVQNSVLSFELLWSRYCFIASGFECTKKRMPKCWWLKVLVTWDLEDSQLLILDVWLGDQDLIEIFVFFFNLHSRKKILHLDHISDARGLHFIIAGDSNDLNLDPILNLSQNFQQIVHDWTRLDPPALLDPIITTLHCY